MSRFFARDFLFSLISFMLVFGGAIVATDFLAGRAEWPGTAINGLLAALVVGAFHTLSRFGCVWGQCNLERKVK